jgi:2-oxoglutarate dehydrogenase E2 component (dihydrolipoamide succinyltransferase)
MAEIVKGDGESCVSDEVIAKIDTEGKAAAQPRAPSPARRRGALLTARRLASRRREERRRDAGRRQADGRQQARAGSVAGTGRDGRVTKGDVLGALEGGVKTAPRRSAAARPGAATRRRRAPAAVAAPCR